MISEELVKQLNDCKDINELNSLLKDNRINITSKDIVKAINDGKTNMELEDDDLANVNGGVDILSIALQEFTKYGRGKLGEFIKNLLENNEIGR